MLLRICSVFLRLHLIIVRVYDKFLQVTGRGLFAECGKNVHYHPLTSTITYSHVHIGNDVQISEGANLIAAIAHIYIGNKVRFGPNVTIRGGNHVTDYLGYFMFDIKDSEKRPSDDRDVIIEDDVWIGTNVTILKGVTIGRGAVVGAGAVVTKNMPPYSISGGVPAKVIKYRFTPDQIIEHEKKLYTESRRLTLDYVNSLNLANREI